MTVTLPVRLISGAILLSGLSACGSDKPADKPAETAAVTTAPAVATTAPVAVAPPAPMPAAPVVAAPAVATPAAAPAAAPAPAGATYAALTGDAARGEKIFGQCKTCHVAEPGVNRIGPSLWGVVGRPAGSIPGFKYSPANKNSGLTWTEPQLFTYLEAPQKVVPGTYMSFAGLKKPQDRADVITYLKTRA